MKTEFELQNGMSQKTGVVSIVGAAPKYNPYVTMEIDGLDYNIFIPQKCLEQFAVNILKALKSNRLNQ